jgi:serine/threonine protein kinase
MLKKILSSATKPKMPRTDIGKRFELIAERPASMSRPWKAHDRKIGRTVFLKIIFPEGTDDLNLRFPGRPTEGAIGMSLRHPNVVRTLDHGLTKEGEEFVVMEWIEGLGLNYLIETKSPTLNGKRIHYLAEMATGLEYVHGQGYMHHDFCPRNVMLEQDGNVKLIDFGLALPCQGAFLKEGNRKGTRNYMAPELIKRQKIDRRIDLFALGVTAYEMITGRRPWEGDKSLDLLQLMINTPARDPRESSPDLDPPIDEFLKKAVEREPNRRFQSAAEFRNALKALPRQDY